MITHFSQQEGLHSGQSTQLKTICNQYIEEQNTTLQYACMTESAFSIKAFIDNLYHLK